MYKTYPQLEVGDYVSFMDDDNILYKVLQIKKIHILIHDPVSNDTEWERQEYIERIYKVKLERK